MLCIRGVAGMELLWDVSYLLAIMPTDFLSVTEKGKM